MKTYSAKPGEVRQDWLLIDGTDLVLGRLAAAVALRLRGKHKPEYTPHVDTGDYIIVVNAARVWTTGRKETDKFYYRTTGYVGNIKSISLEKLLRKAPERVVQIAVKGMLPKNRLGADTYRKLKVYAGAEHPHAAQQPEVLEINVR